MIAGPDLGSSVLAAPLDPVLLAAQCFQVVAAGGDDGVVGARAASVMARARSAPWTAGSACCQPIASLTCFEASRQSCPTNGSLGWPTE
jgi:hypothetical protein